MLLYNDNLHYSIVTAVKAATAAAVTQNRRDYNNKNKPAVVLLIGKYFLDCISRMYGSLYEATKYFVVTFYRDNIQTQHQQRA